MAELIDEAWQLVFGGRMQDLDVDRPITMDHPIPQLGRLRPRDVGEACLDLVGKLARGLSHHAEVPQQGISTLSVQAEILEVDALDQPLYLFSRVDHLANEQELTPHKARELQLGRTRGVDRAERSAR